VELTDPTRALVVQLLRSQAYRELGAARLFGHGLQWVPAKWLKFIAWHTTEEVEHYLSVARAHQELTGESVEPWVEQRLASRPIPSAGSWLELAMAQFLYDRAGLWQLKEYGECAYVPYRQLASRIIEDEQGHQSLGEQIVSELCGSAKDLAPAQGLFERWLRIALLSFGRPGSPGNAEAIATGLKRRDSAEVMRDFLEDIKPAVAASRLRFPSPASLGLELPADLDWERERP
jgi:1,2-phenylacetyl-CoA epoxidase catalytic subunit